MRRKKLILNTLTALINQIVTLVCGLVLPRIIIGHYGSATNGLISSITQFLAFFSMLEMGVGAVVRSSLYKPLADGDNNAISRVLISSKRFFNKIGLVLAIYSVGLMIYFPLVVDRTNGFIATAILVGSIALSSIANYLFGIIYFQLLSADQRSYVHLLSLVLTTVLNTGVSVVLINLDASIEIVKLVAAGVLLLKPLILRIYVARHYKIDLKLEVVGEPIKQKWSGLAQHIATYILKHADTVVLTVFSTLENVSIYYVYHLVTNGLQQMIEILTTGMQSLLGNMYAKNEFEKLNQTFSAYEWAMHTLVSLIYTVAGLLIIPFVQVYTKGITDAQYIVPIFATIIVMANAVYCIRIPYNTVIYNAGHFKQTQASAIIEATMNVIISIALVIKFGLVGVAIGTLIAMAYRTCYVAWYLSRNILNRKFGGFIKHMIVDVVAVVAVVFTVVSFPKFFAMTSENYGAWIVMAIKVGVVAFAEIAAVNFIVYNAEMKALLKIVLKTKKQLKTN